jgi:hypothetical protein
VGHLISGLNCSSLSLRPVDLFASLVGADQVFSFPPANRDFYFRAFDGLITRTAAGYSYSGNWASSTGGIYHPLEHQLASLQPQSEMSLVFVVVESSW